MQIVVIGGGVIGLLSARELALAGCEVTVVEQGRFGAEASWAGGGILSPLYPWRYPAAVNLLAAWSQRQYPELADTLQAEGNPDPEWTRSGLLVLDQQEHDEACRWAAAQGLRCQRLSLAECRELEPELNTAVEHALWFPDLAQIRNPRLMKSLTGSCHRHGVALQDHHAVTRIRVRNGRVTGIDTAAGGLAADRVVVASGAWSARLLASLDIQLAVKPVRGQMILFHTRPGLIRHIDLFDGHYLIPRRDGRILVGSTLEDTAFDKTTTAEARTTLRDFATGLFPALTRAPIENQWAGLRPGSPEGIPYICPVPGIDGLYLNTGHYRNGLVLGYASARLLADQILDRAPIVDPAAYRLKAVKNDSLSGVF